MINNYICVPIHSLTGELIALDLTQIEHQYAHSLSSGEVHPERRLLDQLLTIEQYAEYFRLNGLLCCLSINFQLARIVVESAFIQCILGHLPFVRLKLSEDFPNLHDGPNNPILRTLTERLNILWLDDLGAGYANLHALQSRMFEAVKLDRQFYLNNVSKPFFSVLINNIRQYTSRVIVDGVACQLQLEKLKADKVWAIQGYCLPLSADSDPHTDKN